MCIVLCSSCRLLGVIQSWHSRPVIEAHGPLMGVANGLCLEMWQQYEGGDNSAQMIEASGNYLRVVTTRGQCLINDSNCV